MQESRIKDNQQCRFHSPQGNAVSPLLAALTQAQAMSTQALESKSVQREMVNILLTYSRLYEDLRARASAM